MSKPIESEEDFAKVVADVMERIELTAVQTLQDVLEQDRKARRVANDLVVKM